MTPRRRPDSKLVTISLGFHIRADEPALSLVDVPGAWPGSSDVCLFGEFDLLRPERPATSHRGMSGRRSFSTSAIRAKTAMPLDGWGLMNVT